MEPRIRSSERLKKKADIDRIFREGERLREGKLRLLFILKEGGNGRLRVGFGAPKRKLKKAHERNRAKRLMREAFRMNKALLEEVLKGKAYDSELFILYEGGQLPESKEISSAMPRLLESCGNRIREKGLS